MSLVGYIIQKSLLLSLLSIMMYIKPARSILISIDGTVLVTCLDICLESDKGGRSSNKKVYFTYL